MRAISALVVAGLFALTLAGVASGSVTLIAMDTFNRTQPTGWGNAETGGSWSLDGPASSFRVAPGAGTMSLEAPGSSRAAHLTSVSVRDVAIRVRFRVSALDPSGSTYLYAVTRRTSGTELRLKVRIDAHGRASLHGTRFSSGTETDVGSEVPVVGLAIQPGRWYWLRAQVFGIDPTLRARVWSTASSEPVAWPYSHRLGITGFGRPGAIGLRAYMSRSAAAGVDVGFSSFGATNLAAANASPTRAPTPTPTAQATPRPPAILAGAGDIAKCGSPDPFATAALLKAIDGTVFTAGDNAYPDGTVADYACFDQSWGELVGRMLPTPGNHEYNTPGAAGYFGYFGSRAGPAGLGYYAVDLGSWRVYGLNSECGAKPRVDCTAETNWLRADLSAYPRACVAAIWHEPRFNSWGHGDNTNVAPLWQALYDAGAEVVVNGHAHNYERFAPMDRNGGADPGRGIREFVVGTGGVSHDSTYVAPANSEVFNGSTFGVIKLTLRSKGFDWQFVPIAGQSFTDSGSGSCH